jgi:hypothetical protein
LEAVLSERRSGQARLVSIEVSEDHAERGTSAYGDPLDSDYYVVTVQVINDSREPLRDVTAILGSWEAVKGWEYIVAPTPAGGTYRRPTGNEMTAPTFCHRGG